MRCFLEFGGLPGGTRTPYPQLRRLMLYPDELPADDHMAEHSLTSPIGITNRPSVNTLSYGARDRTRTGTVFTEGF